MHISEGILTGSALSAGAAVAVAGTVVGLRRMRDEDVPKVAVLSSAFFVASLIHVPVGPSYLHLVLNGLVGIVLGWAAFPAVLVGLLLQAILFGFGGLTSLGVNTVNMALPALLCYYFFRGAVRSDNRFLVGGGGFAAGALAVALGECMLAGSLALSGEGLRAAAATVFVAHLPLVLIEGFITASVVLFLRKVRPELLHGLDFARQSGC